MEKLISIRSEIRYISSFTIKSRFRVLQIGEIWKCAADKSIRFVVYKSLNASAIKWRMSPLLQRACYNTGRPIFFKLLTYYK